MHFIDIHHVSVVFGPQPQQALQARLEGLSRKEIQLKTKSWIAVDKVSMHIQKGALTAIMGLSGSGKSTLLRTMNGLQKISDGHLVFHTKPNTIALPTSSEATLRTLRQRHTSVVFQNFGLLPWKSVEENTALGLVLRKDPPENIHDAVEKALKQVSLWEWRKNMVGDLSGGMKQRVGLARALCMDTDVILCDEPFSALDPIIKMKLQNDLLSLQRELGKTMVLVTHDLSEALKMASQIGIMHDGALVQMDSPKNLLHKPATPYVKEFIDSVTHQASFIKGL